MRLIPNAWHIANHSWASICGVASSILGTVEVILPTFQDAIPRGWFAIASVLVAAAVPLARVIDQRLERKTDGDQ